MERDSRDHEGRASFLGSFQGQHSIARFGRQFLSGPELPYRLAPEKGLYGLKVFFCFLSQKGAFKGHFSIAVAALVAAKLTYTLCVD